MESLILFLLLLLIVPLVVGLVFLVLYLTYHDLADAVLMLLVVPGAIAGGVFFQWLFGYPFSACVWIGYIACFGMAASTSIIMLVYLREADQKPLWIGEIKWSDAIGQGFGDETRSIQTLLLLRLYERYGADSPRHIGANRRTSSPVKRASIAVGLREVVCLTTATSSSSGR